MSDSNYGRNNSICSEISVTYLHATALNSMSNLSKINRCRYCSDTTEFNIIKLRVFPNYARYFCKLYLISYPHSHLVQFTGRINHTRTVANDACSGE